MSFELVSGTTVDVELPDVPTLLLDPPTGLSVLVSMPSVPVVEIDLPSLPQLTVTPPAPSSSPILIVPGPVGPQGPRGPAGGGATFEYQQSIAQSVWTPIIHNFGRYPVAWSLFDDAGRLCDEYIVQHLDVNTSRVSMDVPTAGIIRLI